MGKPKGSEKHGGRAKGTPNKGTAELRQFFESIINISNTDI